MRQNFKSVDCKMSPIKKKNQVQLNTLRCTKTALLIHKKVCQAVYMDVPPWGSNMVNCFRDRDRLALSSWFDFQLEAKHFSLQKRKLNKVY